ncbi:short-chain dehydrogenase/reductase family 9C member 7 [Cimex lectularius]|uniref:Estradiol 17-beta-dehydrogenase 2 n=1 Tax=Cimex lectularius TaxID=79782 RepID=A0A8I6SPY5_CIMLE|nr:short-chain dehydrogenase/reductase family 9C member 7 [Cimex lectularius]XP_024083051.1 short-chain dehydrogenase/reductase family 9C member 7 [Cimex lectularius]
MNATGTMKIVEVCSVGLAAVAASYLGYKFWAKLVRAKPLDSTKAVIITGCDSGLGFSFAKHFVERGMTVLACVLDLDCDGAQELAGDLVHLYKMDVTKEELVKNVSEQIMHTINENGYELLGLVNNAGVLLFGDFECLTMNHIQNQINVNFIGTLTVTKYFLPLIRTHRARVINLTSHCAKASLPSLSIYCATKAAIDAWSQSLRIEMERFGVKVITFVPGSYPLKSRILCKQAELMCEMEQLMTPDIKKAYPHFETLQSYLFKIGIPSQDTIGYVDDPVLFAKFEDALFSTSPKREYVNENFRYKLYHTMFKLSPTEGIKDYLIKKFVSIPPYA